MSDLVKIVEILKETTPDYTYKEIKNKIDKEFSGNQIYIYLDRLKKKGVIKLRSLFSMCNS